ncbi:hypothetical protein [Cellulophaga sp. BC115SP]|uniref:hypothetical protein n=1 Tax=Cellulophaga sp. BC115SP TaxID=2683263 RepID=UPI00141200D6|nr:hypothetical protein [Cellulophaga sp. BC115SP]NBB26994.1 hypothetical protein [Cellulophaga sp. BC115SP]
MNQPYQVGAGNSQIILNVTVSTVGVAYSVFSVMKNLQSLGIEGESKPRSGNIENAMLGYTDKLRGTVITIRILINFSHLNAAQRENKSLKFR